MKTCLAQPVWAFVFLCVTAVVADEVIWPRAADILDVTKEPYLAVGDGKQDDTQALQRALNAHPDSNYIVYLPAGIYRITAPLSMRGTTLQGLAGTRSIIRLDDNAAGFQDHEHPRPVLHTDSGMAIRERNAIRDITLRVGRGNQGAIGIRFDASPQGTIRNVVVESTDGKGVAGVDLSTKGSGPLLLSNLEVQGFAIGIRAAGETAGFTAEHLSLAGQTTAGIENQGQTLVVRALRFVGAAPAVRNRDSTSSLVLLDSRLEYRGAGGRQGAAVTNEGRLFVRDLVTQGYGRAVEDRVPGASSAVGPNVREYTTKPLLSVCATPEESLHLPMAETPEVSWGDPGHWVAIQGDYGGTVSDGTDDAPAIQQAIDDGAETIFFGPGGRYTIARDVIVRKNVRRLIGTESRIDGAGKFVIAEGLPPVVSFERFAALGGGIDHQSSRTLVLRNLGFSNYRSKEYGTGDLFLEDVTAEGLDIHLQSVWARQLHLTRDRAPKIRNDGGTLWILGLTADRGNTVVDNSDGGQVEILGLLLRPGPGAKTTPAFRSEGGLSVSGWREIGGPGQSMYPVLVTETRKGMEQNLFAKDATTGPMGGSSLDLFVGYTPGAGDNEAPKVSAGSDRLVVLPAHVTLDGVVKDDGRADRLCQPKMEWSRISGPGKCAFSHPSAAQTQASFTFAGPYDLELSAFDGKARSADTVRVYAFDRRITTGDHNGDGVPSGQGADSYVEEGFPVAAHGQDPQLLLSANKGAARKIWLRFDLSAIPGPLNEAALVLSTDAIQEESSFQVHVYGLADTGRSSKSPGFWPEAQLTWQSAPGNGPGNTLASKAMVDLGILSWSSGDPLGAFFRSRNLLEFLKSRVGGIATVVLVREDRGREPLSVASRDQGKAVAPALLVGYIDKNRQVGLDYIPEGHRLSEVQVDPYSLQCTFTLQVAHPQTAVIEVLDARGQRVLQMGETRLEADRWIPFQFQARTFDTGDYILKVKGEAFTAERRFTVLN